MSRMSEGKSMVSMSRLQWLLRAVAATVALAVSSPATAVDVIYVNADAAPAGDGTSWATAYRDLQEALDAAAAVPTPATPVELWVAAGIYRPSRLTDPVDPRTATFQLLDGVALYGGFAGGESDRAQRDPAANETILSGDLAGNDQPDFVANGENSYHVVTGSNTNATAVLDGFTITAGNANGSGGLHDGGGGMSSVAGSPTLANCTFRANTAGRQGGGMDNRVGTPTLSNCIFSENTARFGGGMHSTFSRPTLTNCTFSGNMADVGGGSITSPTTQCCLTAYSAETGPARNSAEAGCTASGAPWF